jgi:hypothetical protein
MSSHHRLRPVASASVEGGTCRDESHRDSVHRRRGVGFHAGMPRTDYESKYPTRLIRDSRGGGLCSHFVVDELAEFGAREDADVGRLGGYPFLHFGLPEMALISMCSWSSKARGAPAGADTPTTRRLIVT